MKYKYLLLMLFIFMTGCYKGDKNPFQPEIYYQHDFGTMTDIDGNIYKTVKIGNQWWMAENLQVKHYRNGDAIPNVTDGTEWASLLTGAYCYYNNDSSYTKEYGAFYNGYAVLDNRKIAPFGWHMPTDEEWKQLEMILGMSRTEVNQYDWRGTDEGGKLRENGTNHWKGSSTGVTNETGFTARAGGYRSGDFNCGFYEMSGIAVFWTATGYYDNKAWVRLLLWNYSGIKRGYANLVSGISLRCIRD